ncbi:type II secretion system F family protein [bacterium]|nr:MAG: type II secretion system F family protein [bacterium]
MPIYVYKATDGKGKMVKGELEANNEMDLTTQLAKSGYLPVSISFKTDKLGKGVSGKAKCDVGALVIFTRQFATIIKAAVPIVEGLSMLSEQTEDPALKEALKQIIKDIQGGISLSQSMSKFPGIFSELYINTVVAGESAGVLDKVLLKLSQMLSDDQETRKNVMGALQYPIMVVVAMVIAILILSVLVIPQFAQIYNDAKLNLPLPTQIMIFISNAIRHYWYINLPALFAGIFGLRWYIGTKQGRLLWDGMKFKIIIFGKIYTKVTMLRFATMLNVLYQAGLPVLKTLDIVGSTIGNVVLTAEVEKIKRDVSDGKGISGAVLNSKFFPKLVGYMIAIGEKSGSLPLMLDSLCEYYDLEVKTTVKGLTGLIEPIMTAVLGVVVMGMCMAIFLPLWDLIQVVKGA